MNAPGEHITEFLEGVVGVVEANSYESLCLWQKYHESRSWNSGTFGYGVTVGTIGDMSVCLSLLATVIDGHKILFYHPTSQVVDHRMVREWLGTYMPKSAWEGDWLNHADAQNLCNVLFAADRMKEAV